MGWRKKKRFEMWTKHNTKVKKYEVSNSVKENVKGIQEDQTIHVDQDLSK